jgi:prevent-host-death family protein
MREVQASEAKIHLSQLLDEVERGEIIRIARHGRTIALLVPEAHCGKQKLAKRSTASWRRACEPAGSRARNCFRPDVGTQILMPFVPDPSVTAANNLWTGIRH